MAVENELLIPHNTPYIKAIFGGEGLNRLLKRSVLARINLLLCGYASLGSQLPQYNYLLLTQSYFMAHFLRDLLSICANPTRLIHALNAGINYKL